MGLRAVATHLAIAADSLLLVGLSMHEGGEMRGAEKTGGEEEKRGEEGRRGEERRRKDDLNNKIPENSSRVLMRCESLVPPQMFTS